MRPGYCVEAEVVKVHDGDTINIRVTKEFTIRLCHPNSGKLMFNTPELKTPEGIKSREYLVKLLSANLNKVTVFIPAHKDLLDFTQLSRALGEVYIGDVPVTELMLQGEQGKLIKHKDF